MYPVSAAFLEALGQRVQHPVSRIDIYEGGQVVASTTGGVGQWLPQDDAGVSLTRRAEVRTEFSAEFIDTTGKLNPVEARDLLDPLAGREVHISRGLVLADGTAEYIPTGVCAIGRATVTEHPGGLHIAITGSDRSKAVARNVWRSTKTWAKGAPINDVLEELYRDRLPNLDFAVNFSASDYVLPAKITVGDDNSSNPMQDAIRFALSDGCETYFDGAGNPTKKPIPNADTSPIAWRFAFDETNLKLPGSTRGIDADTVRNGVIVRGSAPWLNFPVSGSAWDTDPGSPTYYDPANPSVSPLGPRPVELEDLYVGSAAQCEEIAQAALADHLGIEETFDWSYVPHAALEVGDVVEVESAAFDARQRFVIESQQLGILISANDSASSRRRRVR